MTASMLGLLEHIKVVKVFPVNDTDGWFFRPVSEAEKALVSQVDETVVWDREDPLCKDYTHLHQVYTHCNPKVSGRVSVPLLVDKKTNKGICSESKDISMLFIQRFKKLHVSSPPLDLALGDDVMKLWDTVHSSINGKVYGVHFAAKQADFETRQSEFWSEMDKLELRLQKNTDEGQKVAYLLPGHGPTLVDLQAFATLVRLDCAYHHRFRLTRHTLAGGRYPYLLAFVQRLYQMPEIQACVHFGGICAMYYLSQPLRVKAGCTIAPMPERYQPILERAPGSGPALWASSPSPMPSQASASIEPAQGDAVTADTQCSADAHCMASVQRAPSEGFTTPQVLAIALCGAAAGYLARRFSEQ